MAKKKEPKLEALPGEVGTDAMVRAIGEFFAPKVDPEQEELERLRELCRKGNPFPLAAKQWPELVLKDQREIEIFQRAMTEERFKYLSDSIKEACFCPDSPPLRLDWWQKAILAGFFALDIGEEYIKGCTGAGKGGSTAMGFCLWYDVFESCRISLTGRDRDHAIKNIFGETKSWFMKMQYPAEAKVLGLSIEASERRYIKLLNPDPSSPTAGEAFSGAHGPNTLAAFDENSSLPDIFVENARKNARKIICLSNPRIRAGDFYRAFEGMGNGLMDTTGCCKGRLGKRLCVTIGGEDCINVSENRLKTPVAPPGGFEISGVVYGEMDVIREEHLEEIKPLIPGQMDVLQFRNALSDRMPECFAHGRFPAEDSEIQIIVPSWLKRHEEAWSTEIPVTCIGLDVALSLDGDDTVAAVGSDVGCRKLHPMKLENPNEIANEVIRILYKDYEIDLTLGQNPVCVDYGGGYGRSVGPLLKDKGVWVIPFEPGGTSTTPRTYANMRAQGYGELAIRLDPNGPFEEPWGLPDIPGLREELCAPEREYATDMIRWKVQPKPEIKKQLGRSPDNADALTYLFHAVSVFNNLDKFLKGLKSRPVVLYPRNKEQIEERKQELKKYEKSEYDDVKFDWTPTEPRTIVVNPPDKNQRKPWWDRYLKD